VENPKNLEMDVQALQAIKDKTGTEYEELKTKYSIEA
jgi:hypothetical protein